MAWSMEGTVLVACNCDYGCPCNYNALPTNGDCEGGWMWIVDKGSYDGVDVGGLMLAVFADWPGAIHEGNGVAVAYIDERADDDQRAALTKLVRGEDGGPWAIFINTYALDGPHFVPFQVELAGHFTKLSIGGAVELEMQPIKNPVTGNEVHPSVRLPEGSRTLGWTSFPVTGFLIGCISSSTAPPIESFVKCPASSTWNGTKCGPSSAYVLMKIAQGPPSSPRTSFVSAARWSSSARSSTYATATPFPS